MTIAFLEWHEYPPQEMRGGGVTVGNLDGVHRGHQVLIAACIRQAQAVDGPAVAVTFDPPPHQVLHPGTERPPLTTIAQRAKLLNALGVNHVAVLRTSPALLALSAEAFFEDVLARQLGAKAVVEGFNFCFGRKRSGTTHTLRELCRNASIAFEEVSSVRWDGEPVSSSRVRAALVSGAVTHAAELLGRNYRIAGEVIAGAKRGRTIGFPTANLGGIPTVLPGNGVYAVRATVEGRTWHAAANIGPNPTFGENAQKVEIHLLDFTNDVYGQSMEVEFIARLRDTRPFTDVGELIEQLKRDVEQARQALA